MLKPVCLFLMMTSFVSPVFAQDSPRVKTANGTVEGVIEPSGIRSFKGIPFAQPPVGALRWREPQPVKNWEGVHKADHFAASPMQRPIFGDMNFRSKGVNEDCLYLNVWTPAKSGNERLPVLVYFYGGGFMAGDGSEPRYDGESMATKGIVSLTVNYRLNVFGFLAHPELTKESPHGSSGNYGLMDQYAALEWVKKNIAAFGGDPTRVTIAGESAGSASVSAQMASPLAKNLFAQAIGESGSLMGTLTPVRLSEAEEKGKAFGTSIGAATLSELRALPADQLLETTAKAAPGSFPVAVDGYFFPKSVGEIFAAGEQAQVPLMVGWNSEEMNYKYLFGTQKPTVENYKKVVQDRLGPASESILKAYAVTSDDQVESVATDLAGDLFIGYSTWRWAEWQMKTSNKPVYRYYFEKPRPAMRAEMGNATPGLAGGVVKGNANTPPAPAAKGAVHSAEIEYAMGNLGSNKVYDWTKDDYNVSKVMQEYFANFIKTGNPNGTGLPKWSPSKTGNVQVMHIGTNTQSKPDVHHNRYVAIDQMQKK